MELGLAEAWATGDASLLGPAGALLVALVTVAVLDMGLRLMLTCTGSWDRGQRWYFLHSMANWLVVATGFQDVVVSFDAPANSMNPAQPWSQVPGGFVAAIHLYHLIAFKVNTEDLFHHLVFAAVGCGSNFLVKYGPIANLYFFFICGLPGAIDYFLLGLVKIERINRLTEKRINNALNLWLRGPGLTLVFAFALAAYRTGNHAVNATVMLILLGISIGNGQYYLGRVSASYAISLYKCKAEKAA